MSQEPPMVTTSCQADVTASRTILDDFEDVFKKYDPDVTIENDSDFDGLPAIRVTYMRIPYAVIVAENNCKRLDVLAERCYNDPDPQTDYEDLKRNADITAAIEAIVIHATRIHVIDDVQHIVDMMHPNDRCNDKSCEICFPSNID